MNKTCAYCGATFDPEKVQHFRVAQVEPQEDPGDHQDEWGVMHVKCFHQALSTPQAALHALRAEARALRQEEHSS